MRRKVVIVLAVSILALSSSICASAQIKKQDGPGKFIQASKFLEENPLIKEAKNIRRWAFQWVMEHKVITGGCPLLLPGIQLKYKYSGEIFTQYWIGMAAFKLAYPNEANDQTAVELAGIESALKSYEAMVREQPKTKVPFFDELVAKKTDSSLAQYVTDYVTMNCKGKRKR